MVVAVVVFINFLNRDFICFGVWDFRRTFGPYPEGNKLSVTLNSLFAFTNLKRWSDFDT